MAKRFYRSTTERKIWGVCGGLADYFAMDPTLVRVIFVVLVFVSGIGILLYILLAIAAPSAGPASESSGSSQPAAPSGSTQQEEREAPEYGRRSGTLLVGAILVAVGIILLLSNLNLAWWLRWGIIGPLILIALGLMLFLGRGRK
ncbi:MAG: PspC domain-containing protein [Chloroflexota bacterium]